MAGQNSRRKGHAQVQELAGAQAFLASLTGPNAQHECPDQALRARQWAVWAAQQRGLVDDRTHGRATAGDASSTSNVRWRIRWPLRHTDGAAVHTDMTIGLVVPNATDAVSPEGLKLYPDVHFVARGVGVKGLSAEGFHDSWNAIVPAAEHLAAAGVHAIMLMGTSLTFHRGFEAHERLVERVRSLTGLPVSSMSAALVDGLRELGATRVGVATAYSDEVNLRLREFLVANGIDVLALQGFGLVSFGAPGLKTREDIMALASDVLADAGAAEGLVISCGGLRTLEVIAPLEAEHHVPVVSSTPAAYWAAVRLAGLPSAVPGYGRLLAAEAPVRSA